MEEVASLKYEYIGSRNETSDLPLLTFALFSYNQEKYIRDAVKGALSQTYSPLEIILSDDASTDDTFDEIMKLARTYSGPHKLTVLRNERNLGLMGHINSLSRIWNGEIIIFAAGDDISNPFRSDRIAQCFHTNHPKYAVFSDLDYIGECPPNSVGAQAEHRISDTELLLNGGGIGLGATYAYRRECFDKFPTIESNLKSEDRILPWRAQILGGIGYISEPLVSYRVHNESLSRSKLHNPWPARLREDHLSMVRNDTIAAYNAGMMDTRRKYSALYVIDRVRRHWDTIEYFQRKNSALGRVIEMALTLRIRITQKFAWVERSEQ